MIYGISIITSFLNRGVTPNWPFYLMLIGILIGYAIPIKYRSNFNSTDSGIILKNHTRRFENMIDLILTFIVIILVMFLNY